MVLNQVEKKQWFLNLTSLKGGYQFYCDARTFLRLHTIEAWNGTMKVTRLETLFISVNKNFKKAGVRFIFFDQLMLFSLDCGLSEVTLQSKVAPPDGNLF